MHQVYPCPHCGSPIALDNALGAICSGCDKLYAYNDSTYLASVQAQYEAMSSEERARVDEERKHRYALGQEAKMARYRALKSTARTRITLFSVLLLIFIVFVVLGCQYAISQPLYASIVIIAFGFFSIRCIKSIWNEVYFIRHSR